MTSIFMNQFLIPIIYSFSFNSLYLFSCKCVYIRYNVFLGVIYIINKYCVFMYLC
ncbi:hypothetical protein GLOIN_2v1618185 [Rhizophagus irregularis DAOM 181602=DAOM 197198]|uniref:Uncharacterized protein n=1 Tax=Rhizophagus irregularis (strain DAOM 181602 / DAOM 197198 / MUCL 43194) TaxID=747089 RepID=A0A2P4PY25_RHIID|nr:hypothetical protein GLOIN_2v1618185 [Rhizophagus irregularis DAOM 181602=DAOM 197198]POG70288.1 hypothetical protein GLOIN_2v1618185 [Rhizophagus irregularis DAOM 181602=DAOM 197198]|eukprot:XP_025177154.1 hypothetical protein GLOIN_2v1618185 [Rhizophagus irregularis DAOM 181602=DAOM 197198]